MIDIDNDLIGFSVTKYMWYTTKDRIVSSYIIFDINPESEKPITIKKEISHINNINVEYNYHHEYIIERGVRISNYLYVISKAAITSHDLKNDYNEVAKLPFNLD